MQVGYYRPQTRLGQGNIFRSMCQEFCSWGGGGLVPGGCLIWGGAWSREVAGPSWGLLPGGCLAETPPGRLLLRVVRILLECILVEFYLYPISVFVLRISECVLFGTCFCSHMSCNFQHVHRDYSLFEFRSKI